MNCYDCLNFKTVPKSKLTGRFAGRVAARCVKGMILNGNVEDKLYLINPQNMANVKKNKGLDKANCCEHFENMNE